MVSQTSYLLGESTDASISFTISDTLVSQLSSVVVYIPEEYTTASHVVTVSNASVINNSLTLTGITNPTTQTYTPFIFTIYDINNNPIAYSFPNSPNTAFRTLCLIPCRTCSPTNTSLCLTCYPGISWISQVYLQNSSGSCVATCVSG